MELLLAVLPLAGCAAMSLWCHRRMTRDAGCPAPAHTAEAGYAAAPAGG